MHRTCKICNEEKVFLEDLKSKVIIIHFTYVYDYTARTRI